MLATCCLMVFVCLISESSFRSKVSVFGGHFPESAVQRGKR